MSYCSLFLNSLDDNHSPRQGRQKPSSPPASTTELRVRSSPTTSSVSVRLPVRQAETGRQCQSATGQSISDQGFQNIFGVLDVSVRAVKVCMVRVQKPLISGRRHAYSRSPCRLRGGQQVRGRHLRLEPEEWREDAFPAPRPFPGSGHALTPMQETAGVVRTERERSRSRSCALFAGMLAGCESA